MAGKLFPLRYRKGNIGATQAYIEIKNPSGDPKIDYRIAEEIGQRYCNREINHRYIRVEEAVLADETSLPPDVLDHLLHPPKPKTAPLTPSEERELERDENPNTGKRVVPPPPSNEPEPDEEAEMAAAAPAKKVAAAGKRRH